MTIDLKIQKLFNEEELKELDDHFDVCDHGRKLRCDQCSSRDYAQGLRDGRTSGRDQCGTLIEKLASEAFLKGNDTHAHLFRNLAKDIRGIKI